MIRILFIFSILLLFFGAISNVLAQSLEYKLPAFVKNASEDENVNKEPSMQFAFTKDGKIFYKETLISAQILPQTIKDHFETQLPVRHAYIKGDVEGKTATLFEISNALFKSEIDDIRLVVIPYKFVVIPSENVQETMEKRGDGYVFRLLLYNAESERKAEISRKRAESDTSDEDEPTPAIPTKDVTKSAPTKILPKESPKKPSPLVITFKAFNQLTLNGKAMSEKDLLNWLDKEFKDRKANGIFRVGTNEIDKDIRLKLSPNLEFKYLIGLLDGLYGIGADRVGLKIDEYVQ